MRRGIITGFAHFVSGRPWVAINDSHAVRCFSCRELAAGGRAGFCRSCVDGAGDQAPAEELGGEA